jgi:hypothetical protein
LVWAGLEPLQFTNLFPIWTDRDDIAELNIRVRILFLYYKIKNDIYFQDCFITMQKHKVHTRKSYTDDLLCVLCALM